jgi:glutathione S-transferase
VWEVALYTVYGSSISGNCYKVRLILEQLDLPYRWYEVDILKGGSRTPGFLSMNLNGRVPVLEIGPKQYLPESNAILCYLARDTAFWPSERFASAQTLQWLFFEQYSHEPYVAVARFIRKFLAPDHARQAELPRLLERGYQALDVMEKHLARQPFFVGNAYTIADIGLYAYTHVAGEGGFDLERYPALRTWMDRVRAQPNFVPMA